MTQKPTRRRGELPEQLGHNQNRPRTSSGVCGGGWPRCFGHRAVRSHLLLRGTGTSQPARPHPSRRRWYQSSGLCSSQRVLYSRRTQIDSKEQRGLGRPDLGPRISAKGIKLEATYLCTIGTPTKKPLRPPDRGLNLRIPTRSSKCYKMSPIGLNISGLLTSGVTWRRET